MFLKTSNCLTIKAKQRLTNQDSNEGTDGETIFLQELDDCLLLIVPSHDVGILLVCTGEFYWNWGVCNNLEI